MTEQDREEEGERLSALGSRPWRGIAAAASIAIFGIALTTALHPPSGDGSRYTVVESDALSSPTSELDPLLAELSRCRALSPQVDDPACRAAWEGNRRRFFGETRATRVPGDPIPASAPIPLPGAAPAAPER